MTLNLLLGLMELASVVVILLALAADALWGRFKGDR